MPLYEEDSLLGPAAPLDDIELRHVNMHQPSPRAVVNDGSLGQEQYVETSRGRVCVAWQGDHRKPAIVTYHDLGLNYVSSFQGFMNYPDMKVLGESFSFVHINAPGQEPGAPTLPDGYVYPSFDELAEQAGEVIVKLALKRCVGLGIGAGGNVLARLCLAHPDLMECLCMVNTVSTAPGWIEWGYQKMNVRHLRSSGMTQGVMDYLMWHHFGKLDEASHDLVHLYRTQFQSANVANLSLFIESFNQRTNLAIERPLPTNKQEVPHLKVPVLLICGNRSPSVDETVTFNSRLDPSNSQWMKIHDCSLPLEEQVAKVCQAFRLFLQGQSFVPLLNDVTLAARRRRWTTVDPADRVWLASELRQWPADGGLTSPIEAEPSELRQWPTDDGGTLPSELHQWPAADGGGTSPSEEESVGGSSSGEL